jgi:O-antigen/teichoic acid export membrane protein
MDGRDSKYAGFFSFLASLFSLGTGLIFSVMIARRLSVSEYGIWQYYTTVMAFMVLPGAVVDFWMTRDLARGKGVLNAGLLMNGLLSAISNALLIVVSILSGPATYIGPEILLAFILYLFLLLLSNALDSASVAVRPTLHGGGRLVLEVVKVLMGVVLIVWLRMGLLGALVSIDAAFMSKCLVMYFGMRGNSMGAVSLSSGLIWLRRGWIPALGIIPDLLRSADLLFLAWLTGSTVPTAYLGMARTISAVIGYSSLLAISLYPRLLGGERGKHVESSIGTVSMLAFPMAGGLIALALPVLYVFGPNYAPAAISLQLLSVVALLNVFRDLSTSILQGTENVDIGQNASAIELIRSNLTVPKLVEILAQAINILVSLAVIYWAETQGMQYEYLATALSLINLIIALPLLLVIVKLSRKAYHYVIPWRSIVGQLLATAVMVMTVFALYPTRAISSSISEVLIGLLPVVVLGAVIYFVILLAIDGETRAKLQGLYRAIRSWRSKGPGQIDQDSLISVAP